MAVENFTLRMVLFMMEDGNIIKLKDMELIKIKKAINIQAIGQIISKMAQVKKFWKMVPDMLVNLKMALNMEKEYKNGSMNLNMMVIGMRIKFLVKEHISGKMAIHIVVNGQIMKCMVKVNSCGQMGKLIWANFIEIKDKAEEFILGQMVANMKENGRKENSMVQVNILTKMVKSGQVDGNMAKKQNGLMSRTLNFYNDLIRNLLKIDIYLEQ